MKPTDEQLEAVAQAIYDRTKVPDDPREWGNECAEIVDVARTCWDIIAPMVLEAAAVELMTVAGTKRTNDGLLYAADMLREMAKP